jgi:hypothetical protein
VAEADEEGRDAAPGPGLADLARADAELGGAGGTGYAVADRLLGGADTDTVGGAIDRAGR